MLLPPLARAACRPGLCTRLRPHPLRCAARVFTTSPHHRKNAHGQRPAAAATAAKPEPKPDPLLAEQTLSSKEQRKADWAIMREMSRYLWPKDNLGTRLRVGLSVGLLVGAKLLNVQVPFYFKSIVDSMNIDFVALGGTAWTVAGSMIVAYAMDLMANGLTEATFDDFKDLTQAVYGDGSDKHQHRPRSKVQRST